MKKLVSYYNLTGKKMSITRATVTNFDENKSLKCETEKIVICL